ncbi:MAG: extensin family protein [Limimaricola soesokkakensis]|uniref:extensin family protein n=1 Tax=Limimaricola soesokkakensis TaxID=1343159 RepID=UPI00405811EB
MSRTTWLAACLALAPLALAAQPLAPETTARPMGRAATTAPDTAVADTPVATAPVAASPGQPSTVSRPRARLATTTAPAAAPAPDAAVASASPEAVATAARPEQRPGARPSLSASLSEAQVVSAPVTRAAPPVGSAGALCGLPGLEGAPVAPVNGAGACGIEAPVKITAVHGVRIAPAAVVDCDTARALGAWVGQAAMPMLSATGGGLAVLRTAGSYVCRSRNNEQGAQLSEHAFGRAIDITAFGLRDGREISLTSGWNSRGAGGALRDLHKAACGPFGTVLGPDANAAHRDHFHFDTASNRSPYCR